jgi:hypothetical protein
MAELHDDLAAIADRARRSAGLPSAAELRARGDRRRRRTAGAAAALAVLAVAGGVALVTVRGNGPAPDRAAGPSAAASRSGPPSTAPGIDAMLSGDRQVRIEVDGMNGAVLAVGRDDDDQVKATSAKDVGDRAVWVLRPRGNRYQIVLGIPRPAGPVCMAVVHDAAPGSVRVRICDATAAGQLFVIEKVDNNNYSIFNGKRYVQVVDGTNALVPDLPEGLTTTYQFHDRGTPDPRIS